MSSEISACHVICHFIKKDDFYLELSISNKIFQNIRNKPSLQLIMKINLIVLVESKNAKRSGNCMHSGTFSIHFGTFCMHSKTVCMNSWTFCMLLKSTDRHTVSSQPEICIAPQRGQNTCKTVKNGKVVGFPPYLEQKGFWIVKVFRDSGKQC